MLKTFLLLTLLLSSVYATSKVEVYASQMDTNGSVVFADNGVTVIYQDYFLTAKRAIYNRDTSDLELFDDIKVNYQGNYKLLGEYARLNLAKKQKEFKPFYMLDTSSEVWMSGKSGYAQDYDIDVESGIVSGCNPIDPLWKMAFSSSDYDAKTKWLNLYNARFYFYDIPIFYTPYFGYSLDTTRRTGLLMPSLGLSSTEGFYYEQPIYIAEQNWWDLELKPQIRTNRGNGIYSKFRFVDSPVSKGSINIGYFKEYDSYLNSSLISLKNSEHYGINLMYENSDVLNQWFGTDLSGQSGLYVDTSHMNDVEYINLSSNSAQSQVTSNQVLSRINAFYNTDDNYIATYFKYYQDLEQETNANVLQQLPTLHYHYYLDTFLKDHLLYSLDVQSKNIYRQIDTSVVQTDVNLPITLQTDLFDEYLNVAYKANLYMQHSAFRGSTSVLPNYEYQDGYFLRNYHTLSVSTQLTKAFDDFIHVMGFSARYNRFDQSAQTGYYDEVADFCSLEENQNDPRCEFYNINAVDDEAYLDFTQYFFDSSANEFLYHRLSQKLSYETGKDKLGELENELDYKLSKHLSFYNNMFYNYQQHRFTKVFNSITYNNYGLKLDLSHLFKYDIAKVNTSEDPFTKYLTSSLEYDYNSHYSFSAIYNYDIELKQIKTASAGFMYKKRCWDFGVKYSENVRPILNANGDASSIKDRYVFISVVLKPFMKPDPNNALIEYKLEEQVSN
ncbi:LPS-assembly protein LptD [Sulfurimonas marina]|uniref:LPS-assembly protein LptD n=1 Tax=Sulfurimonas marina TaxID=2590551 RepID=A0A7M1AWW2_9BACT|nr:LPS assembly protein LptD [Sulfurimonas marina]QOP41924.1 LPS-assembly protein LptD [Sulfurimonas marina]